MLEQYFHCDTLRVSPDDLRFVRYIAYTVIRYYVIDLNFNFLLRGSIPRRLGNLKYIIHFNLLLDYLFRIFIFM